MQFSSLDENWLAFWFFCFGWLCGVLGDFGCLVGWGFWLVGVYC